MTLDWDIDHFPLKKRAIDQHGMPETDAEWRTWQQAQDAINQHRGGGGYDFGHSEYDPSVWMMGPQAHRHDKFLSDTEEESPRSGYHMPGITHPEDEDEDEEYEREPAHYHVITGPINSDDPAHWTEHEYVMMEHPYADFSPEGAWDFFQQDNPEFDAERNIHATHEVKNVHPAEHHDEFHRNIAQEQEQFGRIAEHGLQRETPEMVGHRAYRYEEPGGVVHRLWHSPYSVNGSGWHTSRYDPRFERDQQPVPWSEHPDNASEDSLGDALAHIERNKGFR